MGSRRRHSFLARISTVSFGRRRANHRRPSSAGCCSSGRHSSWRRVGSGILDIALEAGYSSHEAFVRAFRRAYGVNPSEWRESPRQIKLPTPNDVHFHPPGGLRLPTKTEITSMDLIVRMVEHHVWLVGEMVDEPPGSTTTKLDEPIAISVEDIDDDPDHPLTAVTAGWPDGHVESHHPRPGLRLGRGEARVDREHAQASDHGRTRSSWPTRRASVSEGRLDDTFIDAHCTPVEVFTYGGMIAHVLTFAAHRRVLVLGALESAGIPDLGNGDPRKWVAEAACYDPNPPARKRRARRSRHRPRPESPLSAACPPNAAC